MRRVARPRGRDQPPRATGVDDPAPDARRCPAPSFSRCQIISRIIFPPTGPFTLERVAIGSDADVSGPRPRAVDDRDCAQAAVLCIRADGGRGAADREQLEGTNLGTITGVSSTGTLRTATRRRSNDGHRLERRQHDRRGQRPARLADRCPANWKPATGSARSTGPSGSAAPPSGPRLTAMPRRLFRAGRGGAARAVHSGSRHPRRGQCCQRDSSPTHSPQRWPARRRRRPSPRVPGRCFTVAQRAANDEALPWSGRVVAGVPAADGRAARRDRPGGCVAPASIWCRPTPSCRWRPTHASSQATWSASTPRWAASCCGATIRPTSPRLTSTVLGRLGGARRAARHRPDRRLGRPPARRQAPPTRTS